MRINKFLKRYENKLSGKTVVLTGCTGGIGKALCRYILYGGASLIMVDRNPDKAERLEKSLKEEFLNAKITRLTFNMENAHLIFPLAEKIKGLGADILIHNAGAYKIPMRKTESGYNNVFTINFVSPYMLSRYLADSVEKIVVVGSIAHNYSKTDENDIDFSSHSGCHLVYGNAKRYLMFSHFELCKKQENLKISVTHPGITLTGITDHYPKWLYKIIKPLMRIVFMKSEIAAFSIFKGLFLETEPYSWLGPVFFNIWGMPSLKALKTASVREIEKIAANAEKIYEIVKTNQKNG